MIFKVSEIIGLKILTADGVNIEDIDDIVYDPVEKAIVGLIVRKGSILHEPKVLLTKDIQRLGKDAVFIDKKTTILKAPQLGSHIEKLARNSRIPFSDNKLVDENGTEYGTISEVFFDPKSWRIVGFEYSPGVLGNKKTMKIQEIMTVGQAAIIVRPVMVNARGEIKPGPNNSQQIFKLTKEKANQRVQKVEYSLEKAKQQIGKQRSPSGPSLNSNPHQANDQQQKTISIQLQPNANEITPEDRKRIEDAIGKYVTKNILLPNDELLTKQNDIVTHELLRVAYTYGLLDQVLQNTSLKPIK
ncbi:hypothetical protein BH09PAT2_BH09PAT2_07770 [soil metagenome]